MADILTDLTDLHKQAVDDRSHYYVQSCCKRAIDEITRLRKVNRELKFVVKEFEENGKPTRRS